MHYQAPHLPSHTNPEKIERVARTPVPSSNWYAAAPAAIDLLLKGKKAIFVSHVEIMKLGHLVPNFDSTSGDLVVIKNRTSNRYDKAQVKGQVSWLSIPSKDERDFGKDYIKLKSSLVTLNFWS